jgi:hypothetical protein
LGLCVRVVGVLIVFRGSDEGTTIADVTEIGTGGDCVRTVPRTDRRAKHKAAFAECVVALGRQVYFGSRVFDGTAAHDECTILTLCARDGDGYKITIAPVGTDFRGQ